MSEEQAASKKAKDSKTATTTAADNAGQAATPATTAEVMCQVKVLPQPGGKTVKLGKMVCGAGAKGVMPQSKAKFAAEQGWVEITGVA